MKRQRIGRTGPDEEDDAGMFAVATGGKGGGGGVAAAAPTGKPSVEDVLAAAAGGQGMRRTKALIAVCLPPHLLFRPSLQPPPPRHWQMQPFETLAA